MPMTISEKILAAYPSQNKVRPGELIEAKLSFVWGSGRITNHSQGQTYQAQAIPEFMRSLLNAGGLIPYIQQKLQQEENLA